jgi:hypothetical protein
MLLTRINSQGKHWLMKGGLDFDRPIMQALTVLATGNETTKNVCSILSGGVAIGRLLTNWAARINNTKVN